MIETRQLQCFVAVAEELHFGRAAKRLNMTQPPLSRQIQILERTVGGALFLRTSRSVQLSEAGKSLLEHARRILRLLDNAQMLAQEVAEGRRGTLRCGYTAASAHRFLPDLLRRLEADIPDASLELKEMVSSRQLVALRNGELDIGLLRPPLDAALFESRLVARDTMVLAVARGRRLADKPDLDWTDLDGADMIMYDSQESRYFYDLVTSKLVATGVFPIYVQRLTQIHSILSLVRAAVGVAVVPESARVLDVHDVVYRDFPEGSSPHSELCVVWRRDTTHPLVPTLAAIAGSLADASSRVRPAGHQTSSSR